MVVTVVCAVLAAFVNALGSVLQRKGTLAESADRRMSVGLLWDLVHRGAWVGGIASMLAGFGFQAAALATGPISLVQPILVAELSFTLLLSAALLSAELHAREWTAVIGMNAGIALLLVSLRPAGGDPRHIPGTTWLTGCAVTLALIATAVATGYRHHYARRAAYLGVASGLLFGFLAVLMAGVTRAIDDGGTAVLAAWQTYAVVVAGPTGFFLLQATLRAGSLVASQPGLTLANPVVGIGWGVVAFGEDVRGGGWIAGQLAGFLLIATCTVLLAHSRSLHGSAGAYEDIVVEGDAGAAEAAVEAGATEEPDTDTGRTTEGTDADSAERNQENH